MKRGRALTLAGGALGLLALACSCAPIPAVQTNPPPPAPGGATQAPAPSPAAPAAKPGPFKLDGEPWIAVGLASDLDSVAFSTDQSTLFGRPDKSGEARTGDFVVRLDGDHLRMAPAKGKGEALELGAADTLAASPGDPREPAFVWRGKHWRGELRVFRNPRGALTLVCRLPLETYLLGVVPGEIGALSDSLIEAGKAQAVAARSYTLFYLGRRASEGFDLYGTVEDQVYGAVETERPLASRCVAQTRAEVALAEGRPIRANYCSTCGGITADVWEAWPVDGLSYLVSHRDRLAGGDFCAASPHYRWREEWSASEFCANLTHYAPQQSVALPAAGVGDIVDVKVIARSESGRVWKLGVTTTTGTIEIPAYSLRQVLRRGGNANQILRSNLFKIDVRRDAGGKALAVVASGAGNGHGAGLCQTGALGMAKARYSSAQILHHYYAGVAIQRLY